MDYIQASLVYKGQRLTPMTVVEFLYDRNVSVREDEVKEVKPMSEAEFINFLVDNYHYSDNVLADSGWIKLRERGLIV